MIRRPPRSTRTDTLFPYTTLCRSQDLHRTARNPAGIGGGVIYQVTILSISLRICASPKIRICPIGNGRHASGPDVRSEEHTSELQSLMRISYAVFCLKKKT